MSSHDPTLTLRQIVEFADEIAALEEKTESVDRRKLSPRKARWVLIQALKTSIRTE